MRDLQQRHLWADAAMWEGKQLSPGPSRSEQSSETDHLAQRHASRSPVDECLHPEPHNTPQCGEDTSSRSCPRSSVPANGLTLKAPEPLDRKSHSMHSSRTCPPCTMSSAMEVFLSPLAKAQSPLEVFPSPSPSHRSRSLADCCHSSVVHSQPLVGGYVSSTPCLQPSSDISAPIVSLSQPLGCDFASTMSHPQPSVGDFASPISHPQPSVGEFASSVSHPQTSVGDFASLISHPQPSVGDFVSPVSHPQTSVGDFASLISHPQPSVGDFVSPVSHPQPSVGEFVSSVSHPQPSVGDFVSPVSHPQPSVGEFVSSVSHPQPSVGEFTSPVSHPQPSVGEFSSPISHPQRSVDSYRFPHFQSPVGASASSLQPEASTMDNLMSRVPLLHSLSDVYVSSTSHLQPSLDAYSSSVHLSHRSDVWSSPLSHSVSPVCDPPPPVCYSQFSQDAYSSPAAAHPLNFYPSASQLHLPIDVHPHTPQLQPAEEYPSAPYSDYPGVVYLSPTSQQHLPTTSPLEVQPPANACSPVEPSSVSQSQPSLDNCPRPLEDSHASQVPAAVSLLYGSGGTPQSCVGDVPHFLGIGEALRSPLSAHSTLGPCSATQSSVGVEGRLAPGYPLALQGSVCVSLPPLGPGSASDVSTSVLFTPGPSSASKSATVVVLPPGKTSSKALFPCPECSKAFCKRSALKVHRRSHTGEKPYVCTFDGCGNRFSRSDELKRHTRSLHTGEKTHACAECGKTFARLDHLVKHLKVHDRHRLKQQEKERGARNNDHHWQQTQHHEQRWQQQQQQHRHNLRQPQQDLQQHHQQWQQQRQDSRTGHVSMEHILSGWELQQQDFPPEDISVFFDSLQ